MEALKITEKTIRESAFAHKQKKPGLGAKRPSNNWAKGFISFQSSALTGGLLERQVGGVGGLFEILKHQEQGWLGGESTRLSPINVAVIPASFVIGDCCWFSLFS